MSNPTLNTAEKQIAAADLFRKSCDNMADSRMKALTAGTIDLIEFRNNVSNEMFLRNQVSEIIINAINSIINGVSAEQADLESAIQKANGIIKKLENIKRVLEVFAALIGLAESIALGKPQGIISSLQSLKSSIENKSGK